MQWNLHYGSFAVRNDSYLVLSDVSGKTASVECMVTLLKRIDNARLCTSNPDKSFNQTGPQRRVLESMW